MPDIIVHHHPTQKVQSITAAKTRTFAFLRHANISIPLSTPSVKMCGILVLLCDIVETTYKHIKQRRRERDAEKAGSGGGGEVATDSLGRIGRRDDCMYLIFISNYLVSTEITCSHLLIIHLQSPRRAHTCNADTMTLDSLSGETLHNTKENPSRAGPRPAGQYGRYSG